MADTSRPADTGIGTQHLPVNLYESSEAYVVVAPVPGVMADDVSVSLESGRLRIHAEMRSAAPRDYVLHEWSYGPYDREVEMPGPVNGVETVVNNGQLVVRALKGAVTTSTSTST